MRKSQNIFGTTLEELRKKKGVSQQNLVMELGIGSQATYSSWETGRTSPNFDFLLKLADFFEVSVDILLGRNPRINEVTYFDHKIDYQPFTKNSLNLSNETSIAEYVAEILISKGRSIFLEGDRNKYQNI